MDADTHNGRLLGALVFVAATAGFLVSGGEPASAQGTAAPSGMELTQPEPTGLLGAGERLDVAWALEEARIKTGRVIYVDVVVDGITGRRVSTGWIAHYPEKGVAYAKETPMPVMAEDLDTPGSIVILVDPFEKRGSLLKSPGLSEEDKRRISSLMTAEFKRGDYGEGLVKASNELVDRLPAAAVPPGTPRKAGPMHAEPARKRRDLEGLLEDRLRELRSAGAERFRPGSEGSGLAVALVCAGTAAVLLLVGFYLRNERYRRPDGPEETAAFHQARRTAEESVAALAPKVLLLAEKQEAVASLLNKAGGEDCCEAGRIGREATGFWKRFSDASALIESDPEKALDGLRLLPPLVEAALREQEEAARALSGEDEHRESPTQGESDARARG